MSKNIDHRTIRPRRLRRSAPLRAMVRETALDAADLIYPLFVTHGTGRSRPVPSMPGVSQLTIDRLAPEVDEIATLGVPAVLLFGIPESKDAIGSGAYAEDGVIQRAVREIKSRRPDIVVITDVCMCEYTDHGHCGLLNAGGTGRPRADLPEGYLLNDETAAVLGRIALSHARAGADVVAPSAMIDGMVSSIRTALDGAGFLETPVMSYAVKYASALYGPFRDAAEGAPSFGDRKSHQMDPANGVEALKEARLDVAEGADVLIVKPGLAYLDIVRRVRDAFEDVPLAAYNVSGEYAMIKAAAAQGWIDERATVLEILTGIRRAGADLVITYHAKDAARWLAEIAGSRNPARR